MRKKLIINELNEIRNLNEELNNEITNLQSKINQFESEREKMQNQLKDLKTSQSVIAELQNALDKSIGENEVLKSNINELNAASFERTNEINELKRALVDANNELENYAQKISRICAEKDLVSISNQELSEKITELKKTINQLETKSELGPINQKTIEIDDDTEKQESINNSKAPIIKPLKNPTGDISYEMGEGAKLIGKVVVQATLLSNRIASANDPNSKELLTLTLGKTEVFKSELLDAIYQDINIEEKIKIMKSYMEDTLEYFKSIEGQLNG